MESLISKIQQDFGMYQSIDVLVKDFTGFLVKNQKLF
jgi:hypothetical protein